jgi:hypothetical protein
MDTVPDPSVLTTAAIDRNRTDLRADLRAEFGDKITALRDVLQTRFAASDRATVLLSEGVNRVPTQLDRETARLAELFAEKLAALAHLTDDRFANITERFRGRDERREQDGAKAAFAVQTALAAQKEALNSASTATVKQIDGIIALLASNTKATDDKIAAITSRLDRGEGVMRGGFDSRSERRLDAGQWVSVVSVIVAVVAVAVSLLHAQPAPLH